MSDELATLDATAQAELVRRGEAKPLELVEAAIARIEQRDPELHAVIHPLFEKARAAAAAPDLPEGPFRGVPILLKDLLATSAGDPYHGGMRLLQELGWTSQRDSHLVARLRAAGFVIAGRTNVPELGLLPATEPLSHGPTRNPWNPGHSTGGSSGGSAAAVAAGLVPLAHGGDGGGSIRIPASECGLVGLKPSRGRTSLGPAAGELWGGLVVEHVLTRSVRDSAAVLDAVAGPMPGDPYFAPPPARPFRAEVGADPGRLRIGLLARAPDPQVTTHPDCVAAAREAGHLLESLGHAVEESHPEALFDPALAASNAAITLASVAAEIAEWSRAVGREVGPGDVEPMTWALVEAGRAISGPRYIEAVAGLHATTRRVAAWWAEGGFDLLLTPTLAEPPPPLGRLRSTPEEPLGPGLRSLPFATFTMRFNGTGQPAISLPLHWNAAGLPVGVQLVAAYDREDLLLRVAAQLEEARPWAGRLPPIHASRPLPVQRPALGRAPAPTQRRARKRPGRSAVSRPPSSTILPLTTTYATPSE